jgi:hypothetical protein
LPLGSGTEGARPFTGKNLQGPALLLRAAQAAAMEAGGAGV